VPDGGNAANEVESLCRNLRRKDMLPSQDDYIQMIKSQIEQFRRVYIVIDALDECAAESGAGENTLDELIHALDQLPESAHILYTGRPHMWEQASADAEIKVVAREDEVREYVSHRLRSAGIQEPPNQASTASLWKHLGKVDKWRKLNFMQLVSEAVIQKSEGM
jgi:hypothetical protein